MNRKIFVVGAFDRYNYGDLLFPVVVRELLSQYIKENECKLYFSSPKGEDYREIGSVSSISYKEMFQLIEDDDIVIVAGGAILDAQWYETFLFLSSKSKAIFIKIMKKLLPSKLFKIILDAPSRYPYVLDLDDFQKNVKVLYNAVGGTTIQRLSNEKQNTLFKILSNANYISVRDNLTLESFEKRDIKINEMPVKCVPDSVAILSDIYPLKKLQKNITVSVEKWLQKYSGNYFCIQIGVHYLDNQEKIIAEQLKIISEEHQIPIVFLPIGTAIGHEDHIALKKISDIVDSNVEYFFLNEINIYNTIALIAEAKVFAGTSLHGAITSMSYDVPHFAFSKKVKKLDNYIKTWDSPLIHTCVEFKDMAQELTYAVQLDTNKLKQNNIMLREKVQVHFNNMFDVINQK